jgi:nucleoid-associated protein YgaU
MPPVTGAAFAAETVDPGWAKLTVADDQALTLICELGERAPLVTQGYGGWEEVDRPGRTSLTAWRGFKPVGVSLPLMIDNYAEGKSIEAALTVLEAMAGRGEHEHRRVSEPPPIVVDTAGVMPHDYHASEDNRWVITDLEFDEESVIVNDVFHEGRRYGNWTRAAVTVSLLQHVTDEGLAAQTAHARERIHAKTPRARSTYTAKSGDTLTSIARAKLGDAGRWRELATLNPKIRDPRHRLTAGTHVRVP